MVMAMTPNQAKQLGVLIAKARARKGLSLRDLAEMLGVSKGWVGRLEAGDYLDTAPDRLAGLADALDIEPSRIDRITKGSIAEGLPELRTYFRSKYELSPDDIEKVRRYVERLRRAA
jgi:transcriptional regulator with XRE-family HTH domain